MLIILNFGSQFAHLIARRVRDLGVKTEILPFNTPAQKILELNPNGIILSGGPASVTERGSPQPDKKIFSLGIPILGICYGHQLIAQMLGGRVARSTHREFGREVVTIKRRNLLFQSLKTTEPVWFSHGDRVKILPKGFCEIASTATCRFAAFENAVSKLFGIQFHPEVSHTKKGATILKNFLFSICHSNKNWRAHSLATKIIADMEHRIGAAHAVIGISGGVDSLVAATLLRRAIGDRLHAVFVDTGLLRKNEVGEVTTLLRKQGFRTLRVVRAANTFLHKLEGITDPERKRKLIGHTFMDVFEKTIRTELKRYPITFLAQGTIYPDRIESADGSPNASKIKSHHNLVLPQKLGFKIIEPLRDLYKDEVRKIGALLGLPRKILWRHPFPGPGLAIRIVGEVTRERLHILREADAVFIKELKNARLYEKIWQAFAVLLPLKTVGVMGDARTYEYLISLRAVDSVDTMTADWHKIPPKLLEKISSSIVGNVHGVNRVLYDITQKPPATIEYE